MTKRIVIGAALVGLAVWGVQAQDPNRPAGPAPSPLEGARRFVAQHDRNRDGTLTRDEVPPDMVEAFARLDANRDGRLSAEELAQSAQRGPQRPPPGDIIAELVLEAARNAEARRDLQQAYEMLRRVDANQDGQISAQEAAAGGALLVRQRVEELLQRSDANRDGRIARTEAQGPLAQDFDRLDTNRDGALDRTELTRALSTPPPGAAPAPTPRP